MTTRDESPSTATDDLPQVDPPARVSRRVRAYAAFLRTGVGRWSNILSILVILQVAFGAATLLTLAPITMQIGHLLLADLVWISLVLMAANLLPQDVTATTPMAS